MQLPLGSLDAPRVTPLPPPRLRHSPHRQPPSGAPIARYEIQRLVLDENHPDWDAGRDQTTAGSSSFSNNNNNNNSTNNSLNDNNNSTNERKSGDTTTDHTATSTTTSPADASSFATTVEAASTAAGSGPGSLAAPEVPLKSSGTGDEESGPLEAGPPPVDEDRKQVGVWIGQRTDSMTPYYTTRGLPMYCRYVVSVVGLACLFVS